MQAGAEGTCAPGEGAHEGGAMGPGQPLWTRVVKTCIYHLLAEGTDTLITGVGG